MSVILLHDEVTWLKMWIWDKELIFRYINNCEVKRLRCSRWPPANVFITLLLHVGFTSYVDFYLSNMLMGFFAHLALMPKELIRSWINRRVLLSSGICVSVELVECPPGHRFDIETYYFHRCTCPGICTWNTTSKWPMLFKWQPYFPM